MFLYEPHDECQFQAAKLSDCCALGELPQQYKNCFQENLQFAITASEQVMPEISNPMKKNAAVADALLLVQKTDGFFGIKMSDHVLVCMSSLAHIAKNGAEG